MKVAIDSGPLTGGDAIRGIGFHTKELVARLRNRKDIDIHTVDFAQTDLSKFDIVHYPYFHPHFLTLPSQKPTKRALLTIHDLIRLVYPNAYPPGIKGRVRFLLQKYNLRNVDAIMTISQTSKKDIMRFLNIQEEKIFVVPLAPQSPPKVITSATQVKRKYKLPNNFVLYVGDVNYNKNLLNLALACKKASLNLVVVGKQAVQDSFDVNHPENRDWKKFLELYSKDKSVLRVGFVPSEDLPAFYKLASVYCQPAFYEGFGLPVLEAFLHKCPVVASRTQALVEIGGDGALFVDPNNPEDFAHAFKRLVLEPKLRSELLKKGSARLKQFSWEKAAQQTALIYNQIYKLK